MVKRTLSIIGYGPFSQLMIHYLQADFIVMVYSRSPHEKDKQDLQFTFVDLKTALRQDMIILGMPAQFIEEFLSTNAKLINPNALVMDVASVKTVPLQHMRKLLPQSCEIIGTHPIFGPGSAGKGIRGLQIVIWPERCRPVSFQKVRRYLRKKGLHIIEKSPQQHDKEMAYVLGLSQYIGRALNNLQIPSTKLSTPAYSDLLDIRRIQGSDSWDLFYSIMKLNPYTGDVTKQLRIAFGMLDEQLGAEKKKI